MKQKFFKKCKPNKDDTGVVCIAYVPDKKGGKKVAATGEFLSTPDGDIRTISHDGDPEAIAELTEHAKRYIKKRSTPSGEF